MATKKVPATPTVQRIPVTAVSPNHLKLSAYEFIESKNDSLALTIEAEQTLFEFIRFVLKENK